MVRCCGRPPLPFLCVRSPKILCNSMAGECMVLWCVVVSVCVHITHKRGGQYNTEHRQPHVQRPVPSSAPLLLRQPCPKSIRTSIEKSKSSSSSYGSLSPASRPASLVAACWYFGMATDFCWLRRDVLLLMLMLPERLRNCSWHASTHPRIASMHGMTVTAKNNVGQEETGYTAGGKG